MISGSCVALVTPMLENGAVDYTSLEKLLEFHIAEGTDALVVIGTTGESVTLQVPEQLEIVQFVIDKVAKRLPIVVGNGTNDTRDAIYRTEQFHKLDIDGMLCVVPYYVRPCQRGLVAHFKAVACATDKPMLLYNVPGRTVSDLLPETVAELAQIDNIVGIKEATGDLSRVAKIKSLVSHKPFVQLSGDDPTGLEFMRLGGDGVISVTSNIAPALMAKMCQLVRDGEYDAAKAIDDKLQPLHNDLFIAPSPTPTKWLLKQMGLIAFDDVRLPLVPVGEEHYDRLKDALKSAGV